MKQDTRMQAKHSWLLVQKALALSFFLFGFNLEAVAMAANWKKIDKLIEEQKLNEAERAIEKLYGDKSKTSQLDLAKSLIKLTKIRIDLNSYESAVKQLKTAEWPRNGPERTLVELYYVQALFSYLEEYSWEIRQREKTVSEKNFDLKTWTAEQIYEEALQVFGNIWQHRATIETLKIESYRDFITPNNFPKHIRSTLRDLITYKAVDILQNTSFWRPEDLSQIYRLNLEKLLAGNSALTDNNVFENFKNHPIQIITYLLLDLEDWHSRNKRTEAAIEANLTFFLTLHQLFNEKADREKIRAEFSTYISRVKKSPWVARALGELASLTHEQGDFVSAHKIAKDCFRDFTAKIAKKCDYLIKYIEQPELRLQNMKNDGLKKRSILIQHKNLKNVFFRAYKVDVDRFLENSTGPIVPTFKEQQDLLKKKPDHSWSQSLPETPDFRMHHTFVVPPFTEKGFYVIMASANAKFKPTNNVIESSTLNISDLVTMVESSSLEHTINVVNGHTGAPVKSADVTIYGFEYGKKPQILAKKSTDGDGSTTYRSGEGRSFFIVASADNDITINENSIYTYRPQEAKPHSETLIYSDRQIYRPKQKVQWKVIAYTNSGGENLQIANKKSIEVYLRDSNYKEIAKVQVETNKFGSASGEFEIPGGSLLGNWQIATNHGHSTKWIKVEEYKRPTFEVSFPELSTAIELNKKARIFGKAAYYFGSPLAEGNVVYRISRAPIFPRWWGYFFSTAQDTTAVLVASGSTKIKKDGSFEVEFMPEAKLPESDIDRAKRFSYEINVDVTDNGGETRSESLRFVAGYALMDVEIREQQIVCATNRDCVVQVVLKNINGLPQEGKGEIKIISLISPNETIPLSEMPGLDREVENEMVNRMRTPGDDLRPRWDNSYSIPSYLKHWREGNTYIHKTIEHDKNGVGQLKITNLPVGAYKVMYIGKDRNGAEFKNWSFILSSAPKSDLKIPILLEFDRESQEAGNVVQLIAYSGFDTIDAIVKVLHKGLIIKEFNLKKGVNFIDLPITPEMRGGITAQIDFIHDFLHYSAKDMLFVPWDNKALKVSFSTIREKMKPGAKETLTIKVHGSDADKRAAEVMAFMFDKSLDLFGAYKMVAPLSLFPHTFTNSSIHVNLLAKSGNRIASSGFRTKADFPFYSNDYLIDSDSSYSGGLAGFGGTALRKKSRGNSLGGSVENMSLSAPSMSSPGEAVSGAEAGDIRSQASAITHPEPQANAPSLRENFSETAFFAPHLVTDARGEVSITFTVPDSLTTWHVWAMAIMKDFSSGIAHQEVQSSKDLMVRLYTPRLFRESDKVKVKVVVNNTSNKKISGSLAVRLSDVDNKDVGNFFNLKQSSSNFTVDAHATIDITVDLIIPPGVGLVKLSAIASSGNISDGEVRTVPILPGRMHLIQSRFVALKDKLVRKIHFSDLKATNDPSLVNEKIAVTVDGQLFFSTLKSLPYLVDYPYECTEQTLNRFISAGIMASLFHKNPNLVKAASDISKRQTKHEPWVKDDPNSRMLLEETPWLTESTGGDKNQDSVLINLLKKENAETIRSEALAKLQKYQTASGGFPWFPGGEPSPYMTLYLLNGFAKAEEFDIPVPKDLIAKAWKFLAQQRDNFWIKQNPADKNMEYLAFLLFTASSFKDQKLISHAISNKDRLDMLSSLFSNWQALSPYSKLMLSLTLNRVKRTDDANLVLDSVLDRAKTDDATGTHWSPEARSWLWYNDTIETHAFALRVLTEMRPKDPLGSGLVQWLFLNKKLNQWNSTKATAEVIFSLAKWMGSSGTILNNEEVSVKVGPIEQDILFSAEKYEGRKYIQISEGITDNMADISVQKKTDGLMFASASWHYSTENLPTVSSGDFFKIERRYFKRKSSGHEMILVPLKDDVSIHVGDEIEVQISVTSKHEAEYIHLRDPRPAGFEPTSTTSEHKWDLGLNWYEEVRDNATNFFFEHIPVGEYNFRYRIRAANAGTFRSMPAEIQSMYAPEFNGFSSGATLQVNP